MIGFDPTSTQQCTGVLKIFSNHPSAPVLSVDMTGIGMLYQPPPEDQIEEIQTFVDVSLEIGALEGSGSGLSSEGRAGAFVNMLDTVGYMIDADDMDGADQQLLDAYNRTDGLSQPQDFVVGAVTWRVADRIDMLRTSINGE